MKIENKTFAFIGNGNMGSAVISGMINTGAASSDSIFIVNEGKDAEMAVEAAERLGVALRPKAELAGADVIVLACKPQNLSDVFDMYGEYFTHDSLYVSMLAGVRTDVIEGLLGGGRVIRFMPNLAMSVGESATAYSLGANASAEDEATVRDMLSGLGCIVSVEEGLMSDVTALSGSGPAYFYMMAEELIASAEGNGMDSVSARTLAVQTMLGAARLILENGEEPAEMRRRVTSKGGTTEAAILAMEEAGFRTAVKSGYAAAKRRSDEMASGN